MKKGGPGGQSREPAGHQGSDWEELGDALSGYPIPALCPWSFEVSLHHLLPLLSHLPSEDFLSWGQSEEESAAPELGMFIERRNEGLSDGYHHH